MAETSSRHEADFRTLAGPLLPALQSHPVPLVVSDASSPDKRIVFVNDAMLRATGYARHEVTGRPYAVLYGAASGKDVAMLKASFDEGRAIEIEALLTRKDGTSRLGLVSAIPIVTNADAVSHYATFFTDTPFRELDTAEVALVASQKQLAEVRERLRLTLSLTGAAAAWEWHIGRNRIVGDPRFASLYGLNASGSADGVSPDVFFSIIHPEDQARVRLAIGGILRGPRSSRRNSASCYRAVRFAG